MQYIIVTILFSAALLTKREGSFSTKRHLEDSVFIKLPEHYDTLNVSFIGKNISRIVFDKFSQKTYTAPEGTSLDVQRTASFAYPSNGLPESVVQKIVDLKAISDSVQRAPHTFFHRHTFFLIITRQDTCYFYHAKGEYLNKNFDNDVQ
ncbi:hypothetical protein [Dinghuibacter silviterrae]|uniref:Uncharacterized protein n=1 Tax=Dinghuibacter silviterrae TaxID=1539049 RepID=A0A4R8DH64_9BACT|nr:hypothetical protein [Dinghuibacter silviterrae]TDW96837.1 hypothetical protein EDB95_4673 [Dinghuibacter silviterrae]